MQLTTLRRFDRAMVAVVPFFAIGRARGGAAWAGATGPDQRNDNLVPDFDVPCVGPHGRDGARGLVAVDCRKRSAPMPFGISDVGMTNRTGRKSHFDFGRCGRADLDIFDHKGFAKFMADGGFDTGHGAPRLNAFC